jgi:hypothetical protein
LEEKRIMQLKTNVLALVTIAVLAAGATAQTSDSVSGVMAGPLLQPKAGIAMQLLDTMEVAPVRGAPFCATVTTEHTQAFADGNRIHTTNSSTLCRDSEGRTRREAGLNLLGAAPQTSAPKLITIVDPVAGVRYVLNSDNKIAHKMTIPPPGNFASGGVTTAAPGGLPDRGEHMMVYQSSGAPGPHMFASDVFFGKGGQDANDPAPTTENLGDQTIDGIHVTGTRVTTTIPAGKMGNDKPIVVTSERWLSSDLKAAVMTKHNDPWAGELKTEFTGVNTSEPDSSLFTVPSDYRIVDDKVGPVTIQMSLPTPSAP